MLKLIILHFKSIVNNNKKIIQSMVFKQHPFKHTSPKTIKMKRETQNNTCHYLTTNQIYK